MAEPTKSLVDDLSALQDRVDYIRDREVLVFLLGFLKGWELRIRARLRELGVEIKNADPS